jgi:hypothetical protein
VYEMGREAEDEDIDVAPLTAESVNSTQVAGDVIKSLDAVVRTRPCLAIPLPYLALPRADRQRASQPGSTHQGASTSPERHTTEPRGREVMRLPLSLCHSVLHHQGVGPPPLCLEDEL